MKMMIVIENEITFAAVFDEDVVFEVFLHVGLMEAHHLGHDTEKLAGEFLH